MLKKKRQEIGQNRGHYPRLHNHCILEGKKMAGMCS